MRKPRQPREARVLGQLECSIRKLQIATMRLNVQSHGDREQLAFEKHRAEQNYELALEGFREFLMPRQGNLFDTANVNGSSR